MEKEITLIIYLIKLKKKVKSTLKKYQIKIKYNEIYLEKINKVKPTK